ncbi:MAG: type II toxin-antitoxin system PemK/MazF family toxin [Leptospirales bacterium]|nr:type II toxin-antitoxin system PemK/MazF family toxin [Leptospirales bacterium]
MVKQGNIILVDFDPQLGHEQKGRRPALVISNDLFNRYSEMAIVCPITHTDKNHPLHIKLNAEIKTTGVILCDQIKTMDIKVRNFKFLEDIPEDILENVLDIVFSLMERK